MTIHHNLHICLDLCKYISNLANSS